MVAEGRGQGGEGRTIDEARRRRRRPLPLRLRVDWFRAGCRNLSSLVSGEETCAGRGGSDAFRSRIPIFRLSTGSRDRYVACRCDIPLRPRLKKSPRTMPLHLHVHPEELSVCRMPPTTGFPPWALEPGLRFVSLARTAEEISVVAPSAAVPQALEAGCGAGTAVSGGWAALKVQGPLDFSLVGILSDLSGVLAARGVSIFAVVRRARGASAPQPRPTRRCAEHIRHRLCACEEGPASSGH